MRWPRKILVGDIINQGILMELTDTKTQKDLLKKLISVYEKRGVVAGARDLVNILKGSYSFILPFREGQLFYCDFYSKNKIFKENIICNKRYRGRLAYIDGGKYKTLNIFHPLKNGAEPEKIY
ncbi:hypothetical protein [uncultured Ilyobacter sp.]|uniref:hypothetical protein n=1 Tax=uncultured Ilyobacter sp. TaxID=544433 RepID=UPI0029C60F31|nr:hypothetical protein [uncultured Ilyobacter sp.]